MEDSHWRGSLRPVWPGEALVAGSLEVRSAFTSQRAGEFFFCRLAFAALRNFKNAVLPLSITIGGVTGRRHCERQRSNPEPLRPTPRLRLRLGWSGRSAALSSVAEAAGRPEY